MGIRFHSCHPTGSAPAKTSLLKMMARRSTEGDNHQISRRDGIPSRSTILAMVDTSNLVATIHLPQVGQGRGPSAEMS